MDKKIVVTCNCIGNIINSEDKFFLMKKKESQEAQSPTILRRGNKSIESKYQSEPKLQKKSLKKRPSSNLAYDLQSFHEKLNQGQLIREQTNFSFKPQQQINQKQSTQSKKGLNLYVPPLPFHFANSNRETPLNLGYDSRANLNKEELMAESQTFRRPQSMQRTEKYHITPRGNLFTPKQTKEGAYNDYFQRKIATSPLIYYPEQIAEINKPISSRNIQYQTQQHQAKIQSWLPHQQQSLYIQGFDQIFKSKLQHQSHTTIQQQDSRVHLKIKQAQKSKKSIQKTLFGRYAQSECDNCSESPPSEVIGKGFDSNLRDFQQQSRNKIKSTFGATSKHSLLNKGFDQQIYFPQSFGANFKSYKNL